MAGERRVFTFWELLARGGLPSLVVNWWGTYPVEPLAGRHLAHGAFQLFEQPGALAPPEWQPALAARRAAAAVARRARARPRQRPRPGSRPPAARRRRCGPTPSTAPPSPTASPPSPPCAPPPSTCPGSTSRPAASAKGGGGAGIAGLGSAAFGELLRWQLRSVDHLLADTGARFDTVVVLFDPGRRGELAAAAARRAVPTAA